MATFVVGALAIVGAAAAPNKRATSTSLEPNVYTATVNTSVYAAQATAPSAKFPKNYHQGGKSFDRFITIWMENTDYSKAAGDPNLAWLASMGIQLSQYYGVTHPSEPNYVRKQLPLVYQSFSNNIIGGFRGRRQLRYALILMELAD